MTHAPRVRSNSARSLNRALVAIGALSALVVTIEIAILWPQVDPDTAVILVLPLGFAIYVVAGIIAWQRRPSNAMGGLMIWTGAAVLVGGIGSTGVPLLQALGTILATLALAAVVHLVVAFPTGRLETPATRVTVWGVYIVSLVMQMPLYLFDPDSAFPPLAIADAPAVVQVAKLAQTIAGAIVTIAAVVILAGRLLRAERAHRRMLVPLLVYSIFAVLFTPLLSLVRALIPLDPLVIEMSQFVVISGVPIAFVIGLLYGGFPRTGGLDELGTWLGDASASGDRLSDALSQALGDPSLELFFRSDERGVFADAEGKVIAEHADPRRGRSDITVRGDVVGIIVYNAELITDPGLVAAAGGIVAVAVERERLSTDLLATQQILAGPSLSSDALISSLTPRQREVLALVADGRSNANIAATLFVTEKTVVHHVSRIYEALDLTMDAEAHRRVQAVVLYLASTGT